MSSTNKKLRKDIEEMLVVMEEVIRENHVLSAINQTLESQIKVCEGAHRRKDTIINFQKEWIEELLQGRDS